MPFYVQLKVQSGNRVIYLLAFSFKQNGWSETPDSECHYSGAWSRTLIASPTTSASSVYIQGFIAQKISYQVKSGYSIFTGLLSSGHSHKDHQLSQNGPSHVSSHQPSPCVRHTLFSYQTCSKVQININSYSHVIRKGIGIFLFLIFCRNYAYLRAFLFSLYRKTAPSLQADGS